MCHIRCTTHDIVCWHTTSESYIHTISCTIWTYDIVCHVDTTLYVHFRHTTLYTICWDENVRCRMCHIRCRMLTYDIRVVRHVRCRTYNVRMSYVYILYIARTTSYVRCSTRCRMSYMHDVLVRHRTRSRWQESRSSWCWSIEIITGTASHLGRGRETELPRGNRDHDSCPSRCLFKLDSETRTFKFNFKLIFWHRKIHCLRRQITASHCLCRWFEKSKHRDEASIYWHRIAITWEKWYWNSYPKKHPTIACSLNLV